MTGGVCHVRRVGCGWSRDSGSRNSFGLCFRLNECLIEEVIALQIGYINCQICWG